MIPHMPTAPSFRLTRPENTTSPATRPSRHVAGKSAELLGHERGDPSTEAFGLLLRRSLCEDADNRLRTGRTHEHAAAAAELRIHGVDLLSQAFRKRAAPHARQILLGLGIPLHLCGGLGQLSSTERTAELQCRCETVTGYVIAQEDDVSGLLAAEDPAFAVQRLEHVPVADVGRDHTDTLLLHQAMEAEVRHRRHGDEVDAERKRKDGDDLIAVECDAILVDRKHAIAVAVER